MKKSVIYLSLLLVTSFVMSCSSDDDATTAPTTQDITLNISGLEDLGSGYAYEGWILVDGSPVSTGTFTVDGGGNLSQTSFVVDIASVQSATKFILTIEPSPDSDPSPSAQKLIAGDFSGATANVSTSVEPAIGDFSNAAGSFFLRTPTDEMPGSANNGNDQYGVWFGIPGMPPTASLDLPTLPTGWTYEGWVVGDSGALSTGTFTDFAAMDDNAGMGFNGTAQIGPPIPGEDFFNNAPEGETFPLDIRGRTVVISVEPVPDNSPAPFLLKPLLATAGNDTAPTTHSFGQNLESLPTGTVIR